MFSSSLYTSGALSALKGTNAAAPKPAVPAMPKPAFMAPSAAEGAVYDLGYYVKSAIAGGICCGVTHGALTPVDVVKTRMQLDPSKYSGMISGASKIAAEEGAGALLTGLAPTCFGYFVQGWFKFGGVEYFKIKAVETLGEQKAWDNKTNIYLGAAAGAEFIADVFLRPLEATRIRLVSNPTYASSMPGAMAKKASSTRFIPVSVRFSRSRFRTRWRNSPFKAPRRTKSTKPWAKRTKNAPALKTYPFP